MKICGLMNLHQNTPKICIVFGSEVYVEYLSFLSRILEYQPNDGLTNMTDTFGFIRRHPKALQVKALINLSFLNPTFDKSIFLNTVDQYTIWLAEMRKNNVQLEEQKSLIILWCVIIEHSMALMCSCKKNSDEKYRLKNSISQNVNPTNNRTKCIFSLYQEQAFPLSEGLCKK